jgi:O-antigen/teichoic acid export membrane protein
LAEVYLGVNGLLSNVLGILALTELGIGTAIGYSLYEPLAKKNVEKTRSLMEFYKKTYRVISLVILVLGLAILPLLPYLIKDTSGIDNLGIIYVIFLINMVIGYLFSYKRTLITSDQKAYKIVPFTMTFNILTAVLQIIVLLIFRDYIIYLLIQTGCILLENIIINRYIDKQYPYLLDKKAVKPLDKEELKIIKTKIKALLLHKVGSYTLTSTDNLIISTLIGIVTVGVYSNYSLIVNMIAAFIYTLVSNVISSLGNLIASENKNKRIKVFDEMNMICFILYGISSICLINLFNPFIELVFGKTYLLEMFVVYIIVINYYLTGMNNTVISIQTASGLYEKDKYVPLIQSALNLGVSIVLGMKFGLAGVFMGTIVSTMLPLIIKPVIVYKYVFEKSVGLYFKEFMVQVVIILFSAVSSILLIRYVNVENIYLDLLFRLIVSVIIPGGLIYLVYRKKDSFGNLVGRIKTILNKFKKKREVV